MEASTPHRKTTTTVSHNSHILEFSKDRGEMRLRIRYESSGHPDDADAEITLPLWGLLEIRDWCALNLPSLGPPEMRR